MVNSLLFRTVKLLRHASYGIWAVLFLMALTACSASSDSEPDDGSGPGSNTAENIVQASSTSLLHVQAAVDLAQEGDTVLIPEGEAVWQAALLIDKALTLKGAGAEKTLIVNGQPGDGCCEASIVVSAGDHMGFRITALGLTSGDGQSDKYAITVSGKAAQWRIDHCRFTEIGSHSIVITRSKSGLIDHCDFIDASQEEILVRGNDDESWENPHELGTAEAVFIEDCVFTSASYTGGHAVTSNQGASYVFRFNTVAVSDPTNWSTPVDVHGNCSTGCLRGARSYEIYNNTITGPGVGWAVVLRGGDGVVYNNVLQSRGEAIYLRNYRSSTELCSRSPVYCDPSVYKQCYGPEDYPAPDQILDAYFWDNTDEEHVAVDPVVEDVDYVNVHIQLGRDYHLGPKVGYEAYPYPHPLNQ